MRGATLAFPSRPTRRVQAALRPSASPRVLFIGGSMNQTTQMHAVARALDAAVPDGVDACFTAHYASGVEQWAADRGWLDFTVLGGQARRRSEAYFAAQGLATDYRGMRGGYDLVVTCSDLVVPRNVRGVPMVVVQEGMLDPERWVYHLVRRCGLPRYLANTSMTGLSHAYDAFCVASDGYRDMVVARGADAGRVVVTGIPNFDDCASYLHNDFPHRGYVLAATSCLRETLKWEDRAGFLRRAVQIADGRPLIVKLHPNEREARARREVERWAPQAMIFADGNTNHMLANCDVLVTKYSSVVFVAAALGKEVHAELDAATLRRLLPMQNGGTSARQIADVCRRVAGA